MAIGRDGSRDLRRRLAQRIRLNGVPVTIVGVSPRGFVGANVGSIADITMAIAALPQIDPGQAPLLGAGNFWLRVLARPRAGISLREANARLNAIWAQMAEAVIAPHWPAARRKAMADSVFRLTPGGTGWSHLRDQYRKPLLVLMGVVVIVLLIACANVASLLLARASVRQREIAMRLAIGARRARIVRQLLIEGTLLSIAGAACGSVLALVLGRVLVELISTAPSSITFDLAPNGHILAFTSVVAIATGILFSLAPALQTTAAGPAAVLKEDARMSRSRSRLLPSLVTVQVALSMVLLAGAGLFARTLQNLEDVDPGFSTDGVLLVDLEGRRTAISQELLDEVQRLPGVTTATLSTHTPLSGSIWSEPAVPAGQPLPEKDNAYFVAAGPRFFATLQIPVLSGREFTEADGPNASRVAIVNETYARRFFPDRNPVGQQLTATVRNQRHDLEIVGLVRNTSAAGLREAPPPTVYVAYAQLAGDFPTTLSVRVGAPVGRMTTAIQQAVQAKLPGVLVDVHPLSAQVGATLAQERGCWRRSPPASGCSPWRSRRSASTDCSPTASRSAPRRSASAWRSGRAGRGSSRSCSEAACGCCVCGLAVGLPAAWGASRWVESMLFGLAPTDPATLGGAVRRSGAGGQHRRLPAGSARLPRRFAGRVAARLIGSNRLETGAQLAGRPADV